ncbi:MAG: hypothetical protein QOF78_3922 [Phycisphaerales bacterium]|nr:hypothetical protein [Phycisphaerales bacterium]
MNKPHALRRQSKLCSAVVATLGIAGFASPSAEAGLIMDLRAVAVNGVPLPSYQSKGPMYPESGDVISLELFAVVSGTNGLNDDTVTSMQGSILSTGSQHGNLSGGVVAPFNGAVFQNGSNVDLDSDGDLDIGAPLGSTGTAATGYFLARSNTPTGGTTDVNANTEEVKVGSFTFTVTVSDVGFGTYINFVRRSTAAGGNQSTAAIWFEDGAAKNPDISTYGAGAPVTFVPEPSAAAVAGLASLGLLARRRQKKSK